MTMTDGQTVYLSFAIERSTSGEPYANVTKATVVSAEHRLVRRECGTVRVLDDYGVERVHATEAEAWAACAASLAGMAHGIIVKAMECEAKAVEVAA